MLYLVKLDSYYKIGYSKDILQRIKQLSPTHVDVELLSTKFGNKDDEKGLHKLCKEYNVKNELFLPQIEVEKIFNTYISKHLQEQINIHNKTLIIRTKLIEAYEKLLSLYQVNDEERI